ncbi:hypothetical protein HH310_36695 [Actinoplanes sp. TBRC 11911]|uniref:beta/gamma crystallin domain-containing protein n=1 Tax=Actinoplanes sp. TBRC 11911 TaxID=2729386 RepID=UPI00145C8A73|nr:beta/gamma crystallin domain-containing protein [Actinoplanes sp. TBRC 11911]NMO56700.1 hypothetical protein [Actinoplanes sp. TBRC 11911]
MLRRMLKRAAIGLAATGLIFSALPSTGAQAINRVTSGCPRADYAQVKNEGVLCFANAGSMAVLIYNVWQVCGGYNNTVWAVTGYPDQYTYYGTCDSISPRVRITRFQIL